MGLDVWFPLAIYYEDILDSEQHNPALLARIHELRGRSGAHRTSADSSWTGDVHNVDRMHLDPSFDWLTEQVGIHALRYLKLLGHDLAATDVYIQRSWPIIARREQRVARHAHHTAHLSAVYYVAAASEGDAGQIRFMNDSRPNELSGGIGSDMTRGYAQYNALNYSSAQYRPVPGRILLFPAKQTHSVDPCQTDEDRVSVSYDLVITSRGEPDEGRYEFLMPPPSIWKRIPRSEPEMVNGPPATLTPGNGRTPLAALGRYAAPRDDFTIPEAEGHVLWSPTLLADCASPAAWQGYATMLSETAERDWLRDHSGSVLLWTDCGDWQAYRDAVDRLQLYLRERDVPLEGASVTAPVLQKREAGPPGPFQRGKAHLRLYLRLDRGDGECALQFAEGDAVALPPGSLLIAGGARRQRITGASHVLHFEIDLPAIARPDALSLRSLQEAETADRTVFAALTAQPVGMPLPPAPLLSDKLAWLDRRASRRRRHASCPATRRFLLEHADPGTASEDELARIRHHGRDGEDPGRLATLESTLTPAQCAILRRHIEAHLTSVVPDSVDDLPEYQVNLAPSTLRDLVGAPCVTTLLSLPETLGAPSGGAAERLEIFLRKYSPQTRPYITFHADTCSYTANIALSADDEIDGGHLLALDDGGLRQVHRAAGTAVLHSGNLVHGVTRIERGVRYSLILFFHMPPSRAATT